MNFRHLALAFLSLWSAQSFAWNSPTQTSPSNGASTWLETTLDWNVVNASEAYQLQVDTSANFNSPLLLSVTQAYINSADGNTDTKRALSDLRFNTTYRWRVRAYITGDTSAWSTTRNFVTRDAVNLTSPTNGASVWTAVTMDWNAFPGVAFYDAQLDTSANFNSPVLSEVSKVYGNASDLNIDTRWDQDNLFFGKKYYWRVRARTTADTCSWGVVRSFNTRDFVTLTSPTNGGSTWTTATMDWDAHPSVAFYDAQVDTSANFNSPVLSEVSNAYLNASDLNIDTRWDQENLFFGQTYHWRVRARNAVDTSSWGTVRSFTTRNGVVLTAPADLALNQNISGITLNWNAHVGVSSYQLQWDTTYQFNSALLQDVSKPYANGSDVNSDTQHPSGALLTNHWYVWQVRAINAVDTSAWTTRRFSTGSTVPLVPAVPVLLSPSNGATVSTLLTNLEWSAATNALNYAYRFSTAPDLANATAIVTSGLQAQVGPLVVGTTYYWSVQALNGIQSSAWSPIRSFIYNPTTGSEEANDEAVNIFPNPTAGFIKISLPQRDAERLTLHDATGRMVRDERVSGRTISLDLSSLQKGSYVLRIHTADGVHTRTILRSH